MRVTKTYKGWRIYETRQGPEREEHGYKYAAYRPETGPQYGDDPEWIGDSIREMQDFIDSY